MRRPGLPRGSECWSWGLDGLAAETYGGMTAEDGSFSIAAHSGVRYRVLVEDAGEVVGSADFVAGHGPLEIRLDPPR